LARFTFSPSNGLHLSLIVNMKYSVTHFLLCRGLLFSEGDMESIVIEGFTVQTSIMKKSYKNFLEKVRSWFIDVAVPSRMNVHDSL